jgi:phenol 2-monooxygenase (NADPH)
LRDGRDIFDVRDIDRVAGALLVVLPDQYVAHVLSQNTHQDLVCFLAAVMD